MIEIIYSLDEMLPSAATSSGLHQKFLNSTWFFVLAGAVTGEHIWILSPKKSTNYPWHGNCCFLNSVCFEREEILRSLLEQAIVIVSSLNLEPMKVPGLKQLHKCFSGDESTYKPKTALEHFRVEFISGSWCCLMSSAERSSDPAETRAHTAHWTSSISVWWVSLELKYPCLDITTSLYAVWRQHKF